MLEEQAHGQCAVPEGLAVAAGGPGPPKDKEAAAAYGVFTPLFAVLLSFGRGRALSAESKGRTGHGCQRPSSGSGPGPTGNCMPEMPDCDQPRRASLCCLRWRTRRTRRSSELAMSRRAVVILCHSCRSKGMRTCQMCPALTQVVSQKRRKLVLSIPQQRSRDYAERANSATEKKGRICRAFCDCLPQQIA